jgi:hypothetical protein
MKRVVLSDAGVAYILGIVAGVIVIATDAGVAATYAIAIGLGIVGMAIIFDPDQFWGARALERLRRRR